MKRHLLRIITCIALLAFVASIALGVSSYWRFMQLTLGNRAEGSTYHLVSNHGRLTLSSWTMYSQGLSIHFGPAHSFIDPDERLGFRYWPQTRIFNSYSGDFDITTFQFPWWSVVLLLGVNAALWVILCRRHARRTRILAGLCLQCGYDLRASPHRCPECGLEVPKATAKNGTLTKLET